jgi:hypothetical protein
MRRSFWLFLIVFLIQFSVRGVQGANAGSKPLSAYKSLKAAQKLLGEKNAQYVLSIESEYSKLQPRYWWIRFYDESLFFKIRSVQMIGPEMLRNIEPGNPFDGGNVNYAINAKDLNPKYDSDRCINWIEKVAKENKVPLHSLKIKLEKPYPGESNPVWNFDWLNDKEESLGIMKISAASGKVLEVVGLKLKSKRFSSVSKKTGGQEVEDTFVGIGADLEEFFSGERTLDKQEGGDTK